MNLITYNLYHITLNPLLINSSTPITDQSNLLNRYINSDRFHYHKFTIYDNNGIKLIDTFGNRGYENVSREEFFNQALAGNIYLDNNPKKISNNQTVIEFSIPIYNSHNVINRVLNLQVSMDSIERIINSSVFYQDGQEALFDITLSIFQDDGSIVYTTNNYVDKFYPIENPGELLDSEYTFLINKTNKITDPILIPLSNVIKNPNSLYKSEGNWILNVEGILLPEMLNYDQTIFHFLIFITLILFFAIVFVISQVSVSSSTSYSHPL